MSGQQQLGLQVLPDNPCAASQPSPLCNESKGSNHMRGTEPYIIGICLMAAVAACLLAVACFMRRKHRRQAEALAAQRMEQLAAMQEAECMEMAGVQRGMQPVAIPVVIVQPDGEVILAEQSGVVVKVETGEPDAEEAVKDPALANP